MTIIDEITAFKKTPTELKDRAIAHITDMTVPLSDRWLVFKEMPDDWKVAKGCIVHFDAEKLLPGGEISWCDDFYTEKHETVDMVSFIEEQLWDHLLEYIDDDNISDDFDIDCLPPAMQVIIDAWREEVLAKNLSSFKFDW